MVISKENQGKLGTTGKLCTAQKMKFSIKDFFSKCNTKSAVPANLATFNEEILNGKLHFCAVLITPCIKRLQYLNGALVSWNRNRFHQIVKGILFSYFIKKH